jgi:hypothetical protein
VHPVRLPALSGSDLQRSEGPTFRRGCPAAPRSLRPQPADEGFHQRITNAHVRGAPRWALEDEQAQAVRSCPGVDRGDWIVYDIVYEVVYD